MGEQYNGDTVELIDYLRTLWWGKWIILGCLVVAVGLSVLFVALQPTTYRGSTEILLRQYASAALAGYEEGATAAMTSAVGATLAAVENAVPGIAASLKADLITLSRSGASSTAGVGEALAEAEMVLEQQFPLALAEELGHLAAGTRLQKSGLVAQLKILRQRLNEEETTAGISLSEALARKIAELEAQLALQQVLLETLETAEPGNLFVLSRVSEPTTVASQSRGKTTIGVAGFLSLMIGVLLTFFVHYLLQIRMRDRKEGKTRST